MTQDKELLLKDLCARLPYEVKVKFYDHWVDEYEIIPLTAKLLSDTVYIGDIRPYLFPLSSMTKEQESYLHFNTKFRTTRFGDLVVKVDEDNNYFYTDTSDYLSLIDWLNKNHFDYRGLIEKGLALDATELNIY